MKKDEIVSVYSHIIWHLTNEERKKVEKFEKDALYLSVKVNSDVMEDAIIRIVKASLRT